MSLAAVLDDLDATRMRDFDDLVDFSGVACRHGVGVTAAHHLDKGIGIDFLERALVAGVDLAFGIVRWLVTSPSWMVGQAPMD
jgi:hypothetical protein